MNFRFRPGLLGDPTQAFGNNHHAQANMGFCASGNVNLSSCGPGLFAEGRGNFGCRHFQHSTPNNIGICSRQYGPLNMAGGAIHQNGSIGQNQWTGGAQHNMAAGMLNDNQCGVMNWNQGNFSYNQLNQGNNMPRFPMSQNALKPRMLQNHSLNPQINQNSAHRMMMIRQQNFSGNCMQNISQMRMCLQQQQMFYRAHGMSMDSCVSSDSKPLPLHNSRIGRWQTAQDSSNMMNSMQSNTNYPTFLNQNFNPGDNTGYQQQPWGDQCATEKVHVEKVVTCRTVTGTLRRSHMQKDDKTCGKETVTVQTRETIFRQTPVQEVFEYNHNSSHPSGGVKPVSLCRDLSHTNSSHPSGGVKPVSLCRDHSHTNSSHPSGGVKPVFLCRDLSHTNSSHPSGGVKPVSLCRDHSHTNSGGDADTKSQVAQKADQTESDDMSRNHSCGADVKTLVREYHHRKCQDENDSAGKASSDNLDAKVDSSPETEKELKSRGSLIDSVDELIPSDTSTEKRRDKSFVRGLEDRHRRSRLDRWTDYKPGEEVNQSIQPHPTGMEKIPPLVDKSFSFDCVNRAKRSQTEDKSRGDSLQSDSKRVKGRQAPDVIKENEHILSPPDKYSQLRSKRNSAGLSCHVHLSEKNHLRQSHRQIERRSSPIDKPENRLYQHRTEGGHHRSRKEKSHPSVVKSKTGTRLQSLDTVRSVPCGEVISRVRQADPINTSATQSYSPRGKDKGPSSHKEGKAVRHRDENRTSVDQMYSEKKIKGYDPLLGDRKKKGDSYQVTNKTRGCSHPTVTERSLPCYKEREKRSHRDKTENCPKTVNRDARRHSDPIITSAKQPYDQQKNERVDFSPSYSTENRHASHSKRTVVIVRSPQKSSKIIKHDDTKTCERQIELSTMKSQDISLELKKNNLKNMDSQGFSFLKPKQGEKLISSKVKSPPRFWSSEYLNYVSSRKTHKNSTDDSDSETSSAKLKSSYCFLPRSVSLGRAPQKLPTSRQGAKNKVTQAMSRMKSREPDKQDQLFTPDPVTVATKSTVSLNKHKHESFKETSSAMHLPELSSLSRKSEHTRAESHTLPPTLTNKSLYSGAQAPKAQESHKVKLSGSGLKITLIRCVKPGSQGPLESNKGSEPKSIPVSRRTNPRTCVSARKSVVTGENKSVRKSRSLECSPMDVKKEGHCQIQGRKRLTRRCLGDRFSLQLKSPLCHTKSFVKQTKSRHQGESNTKSLQSHIKSLPSEAATPLCQTTASMCQLKSPLRPINPPPSKVRTPLCHARSPLSLLKTPLHHVKSLPSKAKICRTQSPMSQLKNIKLTPSQNKPNSSHTKSPPIQARSPLNLIKSPVSKTKTFVTPSTRSLERKICDQKRNLNSQVIPSGKVIPLSIPMRRLRDLQQKPIKTDSTQNLGSRCVTPLRLSVTKKGTANVMASRCGDHRAAPTASTQKVGTPVSSKQSQMFHTHSRSHSTHVTPPMNRGQKWSKKTRTPLRAVSTHSPTNRTCVTPTRKSGQRGSENTHSRTSVTPTRNSGQRGRENAHSRTSVTPTMNLKSLAPLKMSMKSVTAETQRTAEPEKASWGLGNKTTAWSGNEEGSHCRNDEGTTSNSSDHKGSSEDENRDNTENVTELALSVTSIQSETDTNAGIKLKFTSIKKDNFRKPFCASSSNIEDGMVLSCVQDKNGISTRKSVPQSRLGACQRGQLKSSEEQLSAECVVNVSYTDVWRKQRSVNKPSSDVNPHCSSKKARLSNSEVFDSEMENRPADNEDPVSHTNDQEIWSQDVNLDVDVHPQMKGDIVDTTDLSFPEVSTVSSDMLMNQEIQSARKDSEVIVRSSEKQNRGDKKKHIGGKKDYDLRNKRKSNSLEKKRSTVSMWDAPVNHKHSRKKGSNSEGEIVNSKYKCSCKVGRRIDRRGRHSKQCEVSKRKRHLSEVTDCKHNRGLSNRESGRHVDRHRRKYKDETSNVASNSNALKPRSPASKSHGKTKCQFDSRVAAEKENTHRITFNIIQGDQLTQPRLRLRKCVYCGSFCTRLTHIMREHVTVVHPHKCLTCHIAFKNKLEARAHKLSRHLKEVHHCMLCHKVLMSRLRYERHIQCKSHLRLMEAQREALGAICRAFFQGGQEDFADTLRKVQSQETGLWNPGRECGKKALAAPEDEPVPPPQPAPNLSHLRHFYYDNPELGQMVKKFEECSPAQTRALGCGGSSATVSYTDPQSDVFFFPLPPVQDSESWTLTTETESETEVSTKIILQDRDLLDLSLSEALGTAISEWKDPFLSGRVSENQNISNVYASKEQLISDNNMTNIELLSIDSNNQPSSVVICSEGEPPRTDMYQYQYQTDTETVTDSATESSVFSDWDDPHKMSRHLPFPNRSQEQVPSVGPVTFTSTPAKMSSSVIDINTRLSSCQDNCSVLSFPLKETEATLTTDVKVITEFGDSTIWPIDKSLSAVALPAEIIGDNEKCMKYGQSVAIADPHLGNSDMNVYVNTDCNEKGVFRIENSEGPLCLNLTNMVDVDTGPPAPLMLSTVTSTSDTTNRCADKRPHDFLTCNDPQKTQTASASDTDHPSAPISPPADWPLKEVSTPSCTSNSIQPLPLKLPAIPPDILPSHQCNITLLCDYTDSSEEESSAGADCSESWIQTGQDKNSKIPGYTNKSQESVDPQVTASLVQSELDGKHASPGQGSVGDEVTESLVWSKQRRKLTSPGQNSVDAEVTEDFVWSSQNNKTNCSEESSDAIKEVDDSEECRLKAEFSLLLKEIAEDEKFLGTA